MPDIFISYAHADRDKASRICTLLASYGFEVWWDKNISAGHKFDKIIEAKLKAASSVIVLWSRRSVESDWVRAEADAAATNQTMIPVRIERVELPLPHRLTQTLDLSIWDGDPETHEFKQLLAAVERGRLAAYATLLAAANRRSLGDHHVARELTAITTAASMYSDYARLELAYHEFARLGDLRAMSTLGKFARESHEPFVIKAIGLLRALCHLACGQLGAANDIMVSDPTSYPYSQRQRVLIALHEVMVRGALNELDSLDAAWKTLMECQQQTFEQDYPLVDIQKRFDRATLSVIYSRDEIKNLVAELPIREYRGLAHLAAANLKAVRKSPFILQQIAARARIKKWEHLTDVSALRRRCRSFERLVLPIAGSLLGPHRDDP